MAFPGKHVAKCVRAGGRVAFPFTSPEPAPLILRVPHPSRLCFMRRVGVYTLHIAHRTQLHPQNNFGQRVPAPYLACPNGHPLLRFSSPTYSCIPLSPVLPWPRRKNTKRFFRGFIDDRFALTTLQNPLCEVRTYAELVQAAQQERENHPPAARIPTLPPPAAPDPLPAESLPVQATAPLASPALAPWHPLYAL
jgi:hypothetical protein